MSTPDLYLQTAFILNSDGRIVSTRAPVPDSAPAFTLVRSTERCAWAVRSDLSQEIVGELDNLAREEPLALNLRDAPKNADKYVALVGDQIDSGPAFVFPDTITQPADVTLVEDLRLLKRHFYGITAENMPERSPILAVVEDGHAVSVCACARRSDIAAEAGLETVAAFRGHGFGSRVAAAWALAIRASGRVPLYSTSWTNYASLVVARKLGLIMYASTWSIVS